MCILKEAEPKNRGSAIRPAGQRWVGRREQTGSREEPGGDLQQRSGGGLAPGPTQTHRADSLGLSKLELPVSVPAPIHCVSCKVYILLVLRSS